MVQSEVAVNNQSPRYLTATQSTGKKAGQHGPPYLGRGESAPPPNHRAKNILAHAKSRGQKTS